MMKVITMDRSKCVGCRNCELACAFMNSKNTCEREESMIKVNHYIDEHAVIPMTCLHCEEPWCMAVCPSGAITRDPSTNAVVIQQEKCAGCKMCILACPYGNIHFDAELQVSRKCDLCGGRPRCVGHCVAGALNFEEVEDYTKRSRRKADLQLLKQMKENCFHKEAKKDDN
ncbi:MAG: 4Fe-4S dicluster domain-containing protein [Cloacibacillus sp.]